MDDMMDTTKCVSGERKKSFWREEKKPTRLF